VQKIKDLGRSVFVYPITDLFIQLNVQPNIITIVSLFWAIIAFFCYRAGIFWAGAIFLLLCGFFDTLDGEIARRIGKTTKFGGFLDSTIDRANEFLIFFGLFCFYYHKANYVLYWITIAIFGSMMVSYTRARGEGLGISAKIGLFERFTRILLLLVGSFLGTEIMVYIIVVLAIGTILTTVHRIIYIHQFFTD